MSAKPDGHAIKPTPARSSITYREAVYLLHDRKMTPIGTELVLATMFGRDLSAVREDLRRGTP